MIEIERPEKCKCGSVEFSFWCGEYDPVGQFTCKSCGWTIFEENVREYNKKDGEKE